jgi:hypothetical protein
LLRRKIRNYSFNKLKHPATPDDIKAKISDLIDDTGIFGIEPYGLLYHTYLNAASDDTSPFFQDLWDAAVNDSLTVQDPYLP